MKKGVLERFLLAVLVVLMVGFCGLSLVGCGSEGGASASGDNNPATSTENKGVAGLSISAHFLRKGQDVSQSRASRFLASDQRRSLEAAMETRVMRVDVELKSEYGNFSGSSYVDSVGNATIAILYIERSGSYSLKTTAKDWYDHEIFSSTSEVVISEGNNSVNPELFLEQNLPLSVNLAGIPKSDDEYGFKLYTSSEWGFYPVEGDFYSQYDPTVVTGLIPVSEKSFGFNAGGRRYYFDLEKALDAIISDAPLSLAECNSVEMPSLNTEVSVNHKNIMVPDDYETIQAAIDVASAGDVVKIRDGFYYDPNGEEEPVPVRLKSGVNLTGNESYSDEVIVEMKIIGSGKGTCVVTGLTCFGVKAEAGFDLTLNHCITNQAEVAQGTLRLSNVTIFGGTYYNQSGNAVVATGDSGLFLSNVLFHNLTKAIASPNSVECKNCYFSDVSDVAGITGSNKFGHVDFSEWGGYYTPISDEVYMPDGSYAGAIRPWREPDYSDEYYW